MVPKEEEYRAVKSPAQTLKQTSTHKRDGLRLFTAAFVK